MTSVLGIDPLIAFEVAEASENRLLQNVFYVRSVGIDFDAGVGGGGGFNFTIECLNYLDARDDVDVIEEGLQGGFSGTRGYEGPREIAPSGVGGD